MTEPTPAAATPVSRVVLLVVAWTWVLVPFSWGVYELVLRAKNLFG
ncbi:hypothetical protein [Williamsia sp. CHRR-6]|nr:hypothetical protein [Williamsia sp. CHRR-6]MBT0567680.1 hypothetical protein [Williamsia sp. CHRR-6]